MTTPKKIAQSTIDKMADKHALYLAGGDKGERFKLVNCNLSLRNLSGTNLTRARFQDCDLSYLNILWATLTDVTFIDCDFRKTTFTSCNIERAQFINCNLKGAKFVRCHLDNADFYESDLTRSSFVGGSFWGVSLQLANLTNITTPFSSLTILGTDPRGYTVYAYADKDNVVNIQAGCRHFVGLQEAHAHWDVDDDRPVIKAFFMGALAALEIVAPAKGILLEQPGPITSLPIFAPPIEDDDPIPF